MLNMQIFGEKLREHRRTRGLTQEEVAAKIGVSAQAISKWENGECLPDCFNLKALGDTYGISLDILLETEKSGDIESVAARVEQIADEYLWAKADRDAPNAHRSLGADLWKLWKGIYFIEAGDHEVQRQDYKNGNLRVCSEYGLKLWDDDGVACVIRRDLAEKYAAATIGERETMLLAKLASTDGLRLIALLDPVTPISKETLSERFGGAEDTLNAYLLAFLENNIIAYQTGVPSGYKLSGHRGVCAYLVLAAAYTLAKKQYTLSEFIPAE